MCFFFTGRESFSINKEVEDKVTELEAKIIALERGRSRRKHKRERSSERASPVDERTTRRLRRKSLDSATSSEPMKLLMRLSSLETKVTNVNASCESLNSEVKIDTTLQDKSTNLESIISSAKCKLNDCFNALTMLKCNEDWKSQKSDKLSNLEELMNELNDILNCRNSNMTEHEANVISASAGNVVKQFVILLNEKLLSINEKRQVLRENGQLNDKANIELLAEKIAFENVLIGRIQSALLIPSDNTNCDRLLNKEALETSQLISNLQAKLNNTVQKIPPPCKTSAEYLTKVLTKILINSANGLCFPRKVPKSLSSTLKYLKEEQAKLNTAISTYKIVKFPQLAEALAFEAMNLATDSTCLLHSLDRDTINETWKTARDKVNFELIQSEINHVLMRTAQIYESNTSADHNFFFSFFASERAALELWCDSVENYLRIEMEKNIQELTEMYRNALNKLQRQNWRRRLESERSSKNTNILLSEFADIVAHKALIDAKISILCDEYIEPKNEKVYNRNFVKNYIENDKYWNCLQEHNLVDVNLTLEAEFKSMLNKYNEEFQKQLNADDWSKIASLFNDITVEVGKILERCGEYNDMEVDNSMTNNFDNICKQCIVLRDKLKQINEIMDNKYFTQ